MWCESHRRWRGRAGPEDIPLSFQQPFASVRAEIEGSWENSTHTHTRKRKKGGKKAKQNERNVSVCLLNDTQKVASGDASLKLWTCFVICVKKHLRACNVINIRQLTSVWWHIYLHLPQNAFSISLLQHFENPKPFRFKTSFEFVNKTPSWTDFTSNWGTLFCCSISQITLKGKGNMQICLHLRH